MFKKILVALDIADEKAAIMVANRASELAKLSGSQVETVSIVPDYGTSMVGSYFKKDHQKDMMHDLGVALETFINAHFDPEVKVNPHIVAGSVYDQIMRVSEKLDCDLIIMGAHRPELSDYLLGPNASRVVRHSGKSVLVVRDD